MNTTTTARRSAELELLLIGCGLRGTGLLTAVPELFDLDLGIVEAGPRLGPGSFAHYQIESNSYGTDFFGWVAPDGPFGAVLERPEVRALRDERGAFHLRRLARALECFGDEIARRLPPGRLFTGDAVEALDVRGGIIAARLRSGRTVTARAAVLATGVREVAHAELAPWRDKLVLSGAIICGGVAALGTSARRRRVVVVGASHSTYAVARLLHQADRDGERFDVTIVHRNRVKLFYDSREEFFAAAHSELEATPNPTRDACPETGNLFRYSGLRHGARALFRAIASGGLPALRHRTIATIADARDVLDEADVVVQALGYESRTFDLSIDGSPVPMSPWGRVVRVDDDGRLALPGRPGVDLFVMGMDPYPYDDNSLTPTGQYAKRGRQLLAALRGTRDRSSATGPAAASATSS